MPLLVCFLYHLERSGGIFSRVYVGIGRSLAFWQRKPIFLSWFFAWQWIYCHSSWQRNCCQQGIDAKKEKALQFAEAAYANQTDIYNAHTLSTILLWNNEIQRAIEISNNFLGTEEALEKFPDDVVLFLMLLMAKKQYHLALKIFHENPHHLKDRFKPVYYALMHFLTDEFPNEHKKMGGELEETVKEIIEKIKQMEYDYD